MMLSTAHTTDLVPTGKKDPRTQEPIKKPEVINIYNKMMGTVDRSEQMVGYSSFKRRTVKWWKKVFFHVLSLAVLNAYILHKAWFLEEQEGRQQPVFQRVFCRELVKQLIQSSGQLPASATPRGWPHSTPLVLARLVDCHFLSKIQPVGTKKNISRACTVCNKARQELLAKTGQKRKRPGKETSYECSGCKVPPCVAPCFELYHTKVDYVQAYKDITQVE